MITTLLLSLIVGLAEPTAGGSGAWHGSVLGHPTSVSELQVSNDAPKLVFIGPKQVKAFGLLAFDVTARDRDVVEQRQVLSFHLDKASIAKGMTIEPITGAFSWMPTDGDVGSHTVTFTVEDSGTPRLTDSKSVVLTVLGGGSSRTWVMGWGANHLGQLGDGGVVNRYTPAAMMDLEGVVALAGGAFHSLALLEDGTVRAWGSNDRGQLGIGTIDDSLVPVPVHGLTGISKVAAGASHSLALRDDGTVWAWGRNQFGQLGDGTVTLRTVPVMVQGISTAVAIGVGDFHSFAILADGTVRAWGNNGSGRLGDGTTTHQATPVPVFGLTGIVSVDGGSEHSVAVRADGTLWTWGNNGHGRLGIGSYDNQILPVQVVDMENQVVACSAGEGHSIAVRSDGRVYAWGLNDAGRLGDGTSTDRILPVRTQGLQTAIDVATATQHTLALLADGSVWSWGRNTSGRLGDGTSVERPTPVQTLNVKRAISIAIGSEHSFALTVNDPPQLDPISDQRVYEGNLQGYAPTTVQFTATAFDPDLPADGLSFSLDPASLAKGMMINSSTGVFIWSPGEEHDGVHTVTVTVTDNGTPQLSDSGTLTITVDEVNEPPSIVWIGFKVADATLPFSFTVFAFDPDGDDVAFSLVAPNHGASIHPTSGLFSWTPQASGTFMFTVQVTDNGVPQLSSSQGFTVEVSPVIHSISVSPNPAVSGSSNTVGTIELTGPAPEGGIVVSLSSSNVTVAAVDAQVTVPAGQTSTTFPVTVYPVATQRTATITATQGAIQRQTTLTVNPPSLASFTILLQPVVPGQSTSGYILTTGTAPAGGWEYMVTSSHPSLVSVPATITVPGNDSQVTFPIQTHAGDPGAVVTITVSRPGDTLSADLSFFSIQAPPSLAPQAISSGTVVVSKPLDTDVTAALSTSNSNLTIPSSVTILAGQTSATFPITAGAGTGPTTITATLPPPINQQATAVVVVSGDPWVEGTATMNGRANLQGVAAVLQLRNPSTGAVVATYPTTLGAGGTFAVQVSQSGTFDLALKLPTSLRRKVSGVVINPATGATGVSFALTNGDVNGDNAVSIADFLQLRAAYGSSTGSGTWNPNADLNGDGSVGLADFLILRAAFGRSGD